MSGIDPLAALGAEAVAQAQAAMQEAALDLGAAADLLKQTIAVGDLLTATILPPENGVDRIAVLGRALVAQLPPGIHPGETVTLQVTALRGTQILVRNLGATDPQAPQQTPTEQTPARQTLPISARTTPVADPVARPRDLFIEAALRPIEHARAEELPPPPVQQVVIEPEEAPFQARIAFSRLPSPAPPQSPLDAAPRASAPEPPPVQAPVQRFVIPPQVTAREAAAPSSSPTPPTASAPQAPPAQANPLLGAMRADGPASLLARLRVPLTAITLAAARTVAEAAERLPKAYATLDALLARVPAGDARVATLRSLLGFAGRIDPSNSRALPEQIASFVTNIVAGPEAKLAQIVRALANGLGDESASNAPAQTQPAAQARAVERSVALEHDVKTALLALVQAPPQGAPPQLAQALGEALTATTAMQLNVLSSQQNDPNVMTIPLPATFYEGGRPTQLRISRDKRDASGALDADNFHIAFVLDTQSLGTVAIDLRTVGRAVSVNVKTERLSAVDRFRSSFAQLRERFEQLHYRIAAIDAAVAPRAAEPPALPATVRAPERSSNLDMRA